MSLNIEQLMALADRLDKEGQHEEADKIDAMVKKLAVTMVKERDPEFEKEWKKERPEGRRPSIYVGKPEEQVGPEDEPMPDPEKPLLDEELKSKLLQLMEQEWHIFKPGDLFIWLKANDYIKNPESKWKQTEEEIQEQEREKNKWQQTEEEIQEQGLHEMQSSIKVKLFEKLANVADKLDNIGAADEAGLIDGFIQKHSGEEIDEEEIHKQEEDTKGALFNNLEMAKKVMSAASYKNIQFAYSQEIDNVNKSLTKMIETYKTQINRSVQSERDDMDYDREVSVLGPAAGEEMGELSDEIQKLESKKKDELGKVADLPGVVDESDDVGDTKESNKNDEFSKIADDVLDYKGEDEQGEQSKRYDDKHHHSMQVREPKTKQERVDREGREKHHIDTMQQVEAGALNTRYCPEHVGVMVGRVGELTYQCPLDGAVYNWETGWTDYDGKEHPGGSVAAQTPDSSGYAIPHRLFDSRENILNRAN